ncbi:MAG: hypothetical protein K2H64_12835 [Desulfovibrio sp.]|nr:hypothetical protein [Desulfovibrio sp.]
MPAKASTPRIASPGGYPNLGLSLCAGKNAPRAMNDPVGRDLNEDLIVVKNWGASLVFTLLEDFELELLRVKDLGKAVGAMGMEWRH